MSYHPYWASSASWASTTTLKRMSPKYLVHGQQLPVALLHLHVPQHLKLTWPKWNIFFPHICSSSFAPYLGKWPHVYLTPQGVILDSSFLSLNTSHWNLTCLLSLQALPCLHPVTALAEVFLFYPFSFCKGLPTPALGFIIFPTDTNPLPIPPA